MNEPTLKRIVEWSIAILLVFLFYHVSYDVNGNRTANQAHELSERSSHYGPSEVIRRVTIGNDAVIYLGTYKKWFSGDMSIKRGGRWFPGGGTGAMEIDQNKPLTYSWSVSTVNKKLMLGKFYGYVTEPRITKVNLHVVKKPGTSGDVEMNTVLSAPIGEDRMFLFTWNDLNNHHTFQSLQGLDEEGNILYEQKFS